MQTNNNAFILFLKELVLRVSSKSPKFFQILQIISGAFVLITGLPDFLSLLGITIPEVWNEHLNTAIAWASRGMFLISLLTTQSKPIGIDVNGNILKSTNETKLPFTDLQEKKQVAKQDSVKELVVTGTVNPKDNL